MRLQAKFFVKYTKAEFSSTEKKLSPAIRYATLVDVCAFLTKEIVGHGEEQTKKLKTHSLVEIIAK